MTRIPLLMLSLSLPCVGLGAQESGTDGAEVVPEPIRAIAPEAIQADVDHLADDAYYGRYWLSPFGRKAAEWIRDRMQAIGCEPILPEGAWFQETPTPDSSPNVVGAIRGTDPDAGWVVIGAHYDHLPPRRRGRDTIYNGADDNASGVAGMLAAGEALVALKARLRAGVILIAFTGEEAGLKGSRHFVAKPPVPLEAMRGLFNLDMISRGEEDLIFVDGASRSPGIAQALETANRAIGLRMRIDTHPDWLSRSDQWPFLEKGVEGVLFSVEDHEDYHQVSDHADRIIAPLAARVSRLVALATLDLASKKPVRPAESDATARPESIPSGPAGAPGTAPDKDSD